MLNLGIRAHDIDNQDLNDLQQQLQNYGLKNVQLALRKSIKHIQINTNSLNPGLARYTYQLLNKGEVDIVVLGCYINMIHPDEKVRQEAMKYFKQHLAYAKDFGCTLVGTETGGVFPDIVYTEKNYTESAFQKVVASAKELTVEAEKQGVAIAIEGGVNHPIYTPKLLRRLIDEVDSPNIKVIFDLVNYLTPDNHQDQIKLIDEAFTLLGDYLAVIHAKDYTVESGKIIFKPVGEGLVNYRYLIEKCQREKPMIPILLEETQAPYIASAIQYLKSFDKHEGEL